MSTVSAINSTMASNDPALSGGSTTPACQKIRATRAGNLNLVQMTQAETSSLPAERIRKASTISVMPRNRAKNPTHSRISAARAG